MANKIFGRRRILEYFQATFICFINFTVALTRSTRRRSGKSYNTMVFQKRFRLVTAFYRRVSVQVYSAYFNTHLSRRAHQGCYANPSSLQASVRPFEIEDDLLSIGSKKFISKLHKNLKTSRARPRTIDIYNFILQFYLVQKKYINKIYLFTFYNIFFLFSISGMVMVIQDFLRYKILITTLL